MIQCTEPFEFFFATIGESLFGSVCDECVGVIGIWFENGCSVYASKQLEERYALRLGRRKRFVNLENSVWDKSLDAGFSEICDMAQL
jgi:hypothetical protein